MIFVSLLKGLKIDFFGLANNKCINVFTTVMIFPYMFILQNDYTQLVNMLFHTSFILSTLRTFKIHFGNWELWST